MVVWSRQGRVAPVQQGMQWLQLRAGHIHPLAVIPVSAIWQKCNAHKVMVDGVSTRGELRTQGRVAGSDTGAVAAAGQ